VKHALTAERLRHLLDYDRATGIFRWRVTRNHKALSGGIAGYLNESGYIHICIDGAEYKAQRLAWLYVHGQWPGARVDHENGDTVDNSFGNLREATHSQNIANSRLRKDNKAGLKGVSLAYPGRWMANINKDKKRHYLGLFDSPEKAHAAYVAAAQQLFGAFARPA